MTRLSLTALVLFLTYAQSSVAFEARVLSTLGGVTLRRGDQALMARERTELRVRDRVRTQKDSGASLLLGTSIVYLGEATQTKIGVRNGAPSIIVLRGQVRVVATGDLEIHVVTRNSRARITQGILRVITDRSGSRLTAIEGVARLLNVNGQQEVQLAAFMQEEIPTLQTGQEIIMPSTGAPVVVQDREDLRELVEENPIEVEALQDQAADAVGQQPLDEQPSAPQQTNPLGGNQQQGGNLRSGAGGASSSQNNISTTSISASLAGFSASFAGSASGGLFADANQATNQGRLLAPFPGPPALAVGDPFPGNIHLVTNESRYSLTNVQLLDSERNAIFDGTSNGSVYFSIAEGLPTTQVFTDFLTASDATNVAIPIPGTTNSVVRFTQFGLPDAGIDPTAAEQNGIGITGLVGNDPPAPLVVNATPTTDTRANLNEKVTFALGEFRLSPEGSDSLNLAIRRSDQDRLIVKNSGGNDALDDVTPNPDVTFTNEVDPRFLPAAPTVKQPVAQTLDANTQDAQTRFSGLNRLRRAAVTTIMADQLHDFARRTGRTRFVVDGRIIDVSGYQKP